MKLEIIDRISFKRFFNKEDNSQFSTFVSQPLNNDNIQTLKKNIIESFNFSLENKENNTISDTTISDTIITTTINPPPHPPPQNTIISLLDIYYIDHFSKETNSNILKLIQFPLKNVHISINNYTITNESLIVSMIILFLLLLSKEFTYNSKSTFKRVLLFKYIMNILDKEELLLIIELLTEKNTSFPSQGIMNTMIKIDMYTRMYSNDLGLSLYMDFSISEFHSIDDVNNNRYYQISNFIKNSRYSSNDTTTITNSERKIVNNNNNTTTTTTPSRSKSKNNTTTKSRNRCKNVNDKIDEYDTETITGSNNNSSNVTKNVNRYPRKCKKRKLNYE